MRTILVAARSDSFCKAFADLAGNRFHTEICRDGDSVLKRALSCKLDMLVLDMELPGNDGISILSTLRSTGYHNPVIVLTACSQSTYLMQMASRFKVDYIVAKPCAASAVLKHVCEILECRDNEDQPADLNHMIDSLLLDLNCKQRLSGYSCLIEAIRLYNADPTQQITKTIYPEVARICGGSSKRVEHAMRGCIHEAWGCRNDGIWNIYFKPGRKKGSPPTNGEFISKMAKYLENLKTG